MMRRGQKDWGEDVGSGRMLLLVRCEWRGLRVEMVRVRVTEKRRGSGVRVEAPGIKAVFPVVDDLHMGIARASPAAD